LERSKIVRIETFINIIFLLSYMNITKISSKGQIVIPNEIRKMLKLEEGNLLMVLEQNNSICLKKVEFPKVKSWNEATKPFRIAAKESKFSNEDLSLLIEEAHINHH